jgi:hypothetical protein
MALDTKNCSHSSLLRSEVVEMIRDEYSGDRNPRPDLLADKIIAKIQGEQK